MQSLLFGLSACRCGSPSQRGARRDVIGFAMKTVAQAITGQIDRPAQQLDLPFLVFFRSHGLPSGCRGSGTALHRRSNQVAPFGPGAIIVGDVFEAEQILQNEPCVAGAFANPAIRDNRLGAINAFRAINLLEFFPRFERAVLVACLAPRNTAGARDMTAPLARFRKTWRRENFAGELLRATNVDQRGSSRLARSLYL